MKHLWVVLLVALIIPGPVMAQTEVGGTIATDTTWMAAGSPYVVVRTVRVLEGVTLSIEPGVRVEFNPPCTLEVAGTLVAKGTSTDSITFTSNASFPQPGDWGGIRFDSSSVDAGFDSLGGWISGSIIEFCQIRYGKGVCCQQASPFIHQNLIASNALSGVSCYGSSPKIEGNRIEGNADSLKDYGGGIFCGSASPIITGNLILGNSAQSGGGISCYGKSSPQILDNRIEGNWALRGGGICCLYGPEASASIRGNDIRGNVAAHFGGGIYTSGTMAWDVNANKVIGNSAANGGGIYCSSSLLLNVSHNTISHNSASENGGGLFCNSSALTIGDNLIIHNSAAAHGGGIYVYGVSYYHRPLNIIQNDVTANAATLCGGIYSADSTYLVIHHNNLVDIGGFEVYLSGGGETVEADSNWWGTTNLDSIEAGIYDHWDDTVLAEVHIHPYLIFPPVGNPTFVYALKLKSDSTYLSDLTTDLWVGAKIYIQLEGQDSDSLVRNQTTVSLRGNLTDPAGIQVSLTETDTASGIYRGVARIDTVSVEDLSIEAVLGETLTVISRVDSTKFVTVLVGKEGVQQGNSSPIPQGIALFQNYPNPFNSNTAISYRLSGFGGPTTSHLLPITLRIYNILGQEVRTLVNKRQRPGFYRVTWDGKDKGGREVSSGIYFYQLRVGKFSQTRKMVLIR